MFHAHSRSLIARRPGTKLTRAGGLLLLLSGMCLTNSAAHAEWPQWRGPAALGSTASDEKLPTAWKPDSPNIRWQAELPGKGNSSPIVKDGKVFVTTAYEGEGGKDQRANAGIMAASLAGLFLVLTIAGVLRARSGNANPASPADHSHSTANAGGSETSKGEPIQQASTAGFRFSFLGLLDGLFVLGCTLISLGFILYVLLIPDEMNKLPVELKLAFGEPGHVWLRSVGILMIGLGAAFGHFARSSVLRLLSAVVLVGLAVWFFFNMPLNRWGTEFPQPQKLAVVMPGVMAAIWFVLAFGFARMKNAAPAGRSAFIRALLLMGISGVFFGFFNYFQAKIGLWRAVVCLDEKTGNALWTTPAFMAPAEKIYHNNSFATPTPCTDGTYLLAHYGSGYACLDMQGNVLWHHVVENYQKVSRYGAAASPLMTNSSFIIVQEPEVQPGDNYDGAINYIVCLDKATGDERWHLEPKDAGNSYATPLIIEQEGKEVLLVASWELLVAYDANSGERLWELKIPIHQIVPSMVYADGHVYLAGGTHDAVRGIAAVKINSLNSNPPAEIVWESQRNVPECCSPVLYDGKLYTVTANGVLGCFDAKSGKLHWAKRVGGNHFASPVAGAAKIYTLNENGETYVVGADTKYKVLAKCDLQTSTFCYASPAISEGSLFIRSQDRLYCIEPEKEAPAPPVNLPPDSDE